MQDNSEKAVIFDMDGVLVDSAPFHRHAWQVVWGRRNIPYSEEHFRRNFGRRDDAIIRDVAGKDTPSAEIAAITEEKENLFREFAGAELKPLPGAVDLVKRVKRAGYKTAIASSAVLENVKLVIKKLGLADYLDGFSYGGEVKEGKPSPEVFLLAAKRINVVPEKAVVIEDAVDGVAAAKAGGMKAIAITYNHTREALVQADLIVDSLTRIQISDIEKLLDTGNKS